MACYHPMRAIEKGVDDKGKKILKIVPYEFITSEAFDKNTKWFEIPCGKCLGCRQSQSMEWSNRLLLESLYHDSAYFITLTYNNEHLPMSIGVDPDTGEFLASPTLDKSCIQRFLKRIRWNSGSDDLRYYIAGEYGDKTGRPHYHAILFGLDLPEKDLIPCGISETGNQYYRSKFLEENWKDTKDNESLGFVSCEPANYYTFKYVSAYVTKKLGIKPNYKYELKGQVPPFSLSSKNPAIGLRYLEDHPDCILDNYIVLSATDKMIKMPVPKYFYRKFKETNPEEAGIISEKRKKMIEDRRDAELENTDLTYLDYLLIKEKNHYDRLKQRNKI